MTRCPHCRKSLEGITYLELADLRLDLVNRTLNRGGVDLPIGGKPMRLLAYLMNNAGTPKSRETIGREVWGREQMTTNLVDVTISVLRSLIDTGRPVPLIHSVKGIGYVMAEKWEERP